MSPTDAAFLELADSRAWNSSASLRPTSCEREVGFALGFIEAGVDLGFLDLPRERGLINAEGGSCRSPRDLKGSLAEDPTYSLNSLFFSPIQETF